MKKIALLLIIMASAICTTVQGATNAKSILDKTASIVGRRGGASASFKISSAKIGSTAGTIAIKGNKFYARTPQAIVWFNGKTQWSYMKKTNEVNVSTPTQAQQMMMNPYTFITMYKRGYNLQATTEKNSYCVHMTAQNQQRSVQELYIWVDKQSYRPTQVKMRQGGTWTTITISNFKAVNQPNSIFSFQSKDFPTAEVIDLR